MSIVVEEGRDKRKAVITEKPWPGRPPSDEVVIAECEAWADGYDAMVAKRIREAALRRAQDNLLAVNKA